MKGETNAKSDVVKKEEEVLHFWEKEKIFEKSVEQRKNSPVFNFYDGPPFASGPPHYGHFLPSTIKDAVTRFWTMRGYLVRRTVGWDCHGLPVENLVEKELKLKTKRDIETLAGDLPQSIKKFNEAAKEIVVRYVDIWKKTLTRLGRWADYSAEYYTMENDYIESVWWVFKTLWQKKLVYKDFRVTPYCSHCGTPLSNFEVNQGYKDVKDPSIYIKVRIKGEDNAYLLVWTTTPWTLPANVALAVGKDIKYVRVKAGDEEFIVAEDRASEIFGKDCKISKKLTFKDVAGVEYEPLYSFIIPDRPAHFVIATDFVSTEEGTGIVHLAPFFGEDDLAVARANDLPILKTVDMEGKFIKEVTPWRGLFVKDADESIMEDLEKRGLLFKRETIIHSYPFCWRCDSPLLYYAIDAWYVAVTKIKDDIVENNFSKKLKQADGKIKEGIFWVPSHVKEGRFGNWLLGVKDWAVSRNRFWGAPIPIWQCGQCKEFRVIGSREELGKEVIEDLHRPFIDNVVFTCEQCGGKMKRVEEVFDCWFESGSMPYAQWHYPFEHLEEFNPEKGIGFPADFIAEALDQTRGWFYTLHVLSTGLFDLPAFKNVVANGLILAADGKKLSKKLRNYTEPDEMLNTIGADALRYFLLASTAIGEDLRFSDAIVREYLNRVIMTLENIVSFYKLYRGSFLPSGDIEEKTSHPLDKWLNARYGETISSVTDAMENYDLTKAARALAALIRDISEWYVRRSRDRFKGEDVKDKEAAVATLGNVMVNVAKMTAPFAPFVAERIYRELVPVKAPISVHLTDWPIKVYLEDGAILSDMARLRDVAELIHALRAEHKLKVRQPLSEAQVFVDNKPWNPPDLLSEVLMDEVNVRKLQTFDSLDDFDDLEKKVVAKSKGNVAVALNLELTDELVREGWTREIIRNINRLRKEQGLTVNDKVSIYYDTKNKELLETIEEFKPELEKSVIATITQKDNIAGVDILVSDAKLTIVMEKI